MNRKNETGRQWLTRKNLEAIYRPQNEKTPDPEMVDWAIGAAERRIRLIKNIETEMTEIIKKGQYTEDEYFKALQRDYVQSQKRIADSIEQLTAMENALARHKDEIENVNALARITTFLKQPLKRGPERFNNLPDRFLETPAEILEATGFEYYKDAREMDEVEADDLRHEGQDIKFARRKDNDNAPAPVYIKEYVSLEPPTVEMREY